MAVNPLFDKKLFTFLNMYSDTLTRKGYLNEHRTNYTQSVDYQRNMLARRRVTADSDGLVYLSSVSAIVIDNDYNEKYGLEKDSRTLKLGHFPMPYFNKLRYYRAYNTIPKKIPIRDLMINNQVFDKTITIQLGKYQIMNAVLIEHPDRTVVLAFPNNEETGIISSKFAKILSEYEGTEPIYITLRSISTMYRATGTLQFFLTIPSVEGYYDLTLQDSSIVTKIGTPRFSDFSNSWDCMISVNPSKYGKNIALQSTCTMKTKLSSSKIFKMDAEFVDYLRTLSNNTEIELTMIQRPRRIGITTYIYSEALSPIFNLSYRFNPSSRVNIDVFEWDSTNKCKGRKLYDENFSEMYFPNIFDFTSLNINNSDLIIEVSEYHPELTAQIMKNPLSVLIESLGDDLYTDCVVNDYIPEINLKTFRPSVPELLDYRNSEYYGNPRGYLCDKYLQAISSDPSMLTRYFKSFYQTNLVSVRCTGGTPKTIGFGTGLSGEFTGANRVVMNTEVSSLTPDDIVSFEVEHSYIIVRTENSPTTAIVYLNGKRIQPTITRTIVDGTYLFFPVSLFTDALSKYDSEEELRAANPIQVDVIYNSNKSPFDTCKSSAVVESTTSKIKLFESITIEAAINDIIAYDTNTKEFLSIIDNFDIILTVKKTDLDNLIISDNDYDRLQDFTEYFLTALMERFCSSDGDPVILSEDTVDINISEIINELVNSGTVSRNDINLFFMKKMDLTKIHIQAKDPSLIGVSITTTLSNFHKEYYFTGDMIADNQVIVRGANYDANPNRYLLYRNGYLVKRSEYTIDLTSAYQEDIIIRFVEMDVSTEDSFTLIHIPADLESRDLNFSNRVRFMKSANIDGTDIDTLWPVSDNDGIIASANPSEHFISLPISNNCMLFDASGKRLSVATELDAIRHLYYSDRTANATSIDTSSAGACLSDRIGITPFYPLADTDTILDKILEI